MPSFALIAAALSSFPPRHQSSDVGTPDPCAARLPALANSTLASLLRCGSNAGDWPIDSAASTTTASAAAAAGAVIMKPLPDSLSPSDAYHWRMALVSAAAAAATLLPSTSKPLAQVTPGRGHGQLSPDVVDDEAVARAEAKAEAVEASRAAALDVLLAAVTEQPALAVVLFWAQPPPSPISGDVTGAQVAPEGALTPTGAGAGSVVGDRGGTALSGAVLSVLKALSVETHGGLRVLAAGSGEALSKALELVLALWHAEGVGRLGQVLL